MSSDCSNISIIVCSLLITAIIAVWGSEHYRQETYVPDRGYYYFLFYKDFEKRMME